MLMVTDWEKGRPGVCDVAVTSPFTLALVGAAAEVSQADAQ